MIRDLIHQVLAVEQDMRGILNEAREFANQIRDNAEAEARTLPQQARQQAEQEAQGRIEQARAHGEQLRLATLEEAQAQADALQQKAQAHIPQAVDYVLSQVTRTAEG